MTTKWAHLPNARHIDRVLASVKAHPDSWAAARDAAGHAAWYAAWDAARHAAGHAVWDAVWGAARHAAGGAAWGAARDAAGDAALALIAYDDCAHLLGLSPDELRMWAALGQQPAAALLLPAVIAFEAINKLEELYAV